MPLHLRFDPVAAVGAAAGLVLSLWLGIDRMLQALMVVMATDIVTGLIAAGYEGQINSGASLRGMAKKAQMLILVLLVTWLTANLSEYLGDGFPGPDMVAGTFIVTEVISILENARRTGVELGPLERVLAVARQMRGLPPAAKPPGPPHG